jgi:4-amino-4-deoxy-L-arabinose transferase-like glycosyltransferase
VNGYLTISFACFTLSIILFVREKRLPSLIFLILGSAALFSYSALLDPFLNLWDERFHALVAKNMLNHPLKPTLYDDPVVPINYDRWDRYHIWLHKQPLFLWQIVASFKFLGVSEFTLRLPSVIQATLLTMIFFRIGKLLISWQTGFIAAFLFTTSNFMVALVSGRQPVDHNEIASLFFISCSIWTFLEYHRSGRLLFVLLTGLFAGLAFLNKWMIGLLIYFPWLIYVIFSKEKKIAGFHYIVAFIITCLVALPWQIFILHSYPGQAVKEYTDMSNHLLIPMDGHRGNWMYYFDKFPVLYYKIPFWIAVFGFIIMYFRIRERVLRITLISIPVVVYLIFSAAATKLETYPFIIASVVYVAIALTIAIFFDYLSSWISSRLVKSSIFAVLLLIIGWTNLDLPAIDRDHSLGKGDNEYYFKLANNKNIFMKLKDELPPGTVVFNVYGRHYVECMFYTGLTAYNFIPSYGQYSLMKRKNRRIAVFVPTGDPLPAYLSEDTDVIKLKNKIQGWD